MSIKARWHGACKPRGCIFRCVVHPTRGIIGPDKFLPIALEQPLFSAPQAKQFEESGMSSMQAGAGVVVFGLVGIIAVLGVAVRVAPQHEPLEQEEREQADQHGGHHVPGVAVLERVRQHLEEHRAEQRADREADEARDPRGAERQRERRGERRDHAAGERGRDDVGENRQGRGRAGARNGGSRAGL